MIWGLLAVLAIASIYAGFVYLMTGSWKKREIFLPRAGITYIITIPIIIGGLSVLVSAPLAITVSVTVLASILTTAALTDARSKKIPKQATLLWNLAGPISAFASGLLTPTSWAIYAGSVLLATGFPFILFLAGRGIGMGDVRIILAGSLLTAWWAGPMAPVLAIAAAVLAQIGIRLGMSLKYRAVPKEEQPKSFAFGPAIAAGFILVSVLGLLGVPF